MKKAVIVTTLLLIALCLLLASCASGTDANESSNAESHVSKQTVSEADDDSEEESEESLESQDETSTEYELEMINTDNNYLEIIGSSYTDDEYQNLLQDKTKVFVVVGRCEEDAVITAETKNETVTCNSWHGMFSVRLKVTGGSSTRVRITAEGGKKEITTFDAKPSTPSGDMWPIVSSNGYRFFFQKMMPDYTHTNTLTAMQQSSLTAKVSARVKQLKEYKPDAEIIYMIVPSAATIYSEEVPSDYKQGKGESRLEQVNQAIKDGGGIVIDLTEVFAEHKNDDMGLYWRTDSHWNDYGAFVAYTALFDKISELFPDAAPRLEIEFDWIEDEYYGGDMLFYCGYDYSLVREYGWLRVPSFDMDSSITSVERYRENNERLIYSEDSTAELNMGTGDPDLPNLYVLRDSYSASIFDIIPDRCNNCHYKSMWSYSFKINDIKKYDTDYVVYIVSEWNIDSIISG